MSTATKSEDRRELLRFARDVAGLGARIALGHYGRDPEARMKADGTWVSEADWAVEAQIRLRIARSFPEHNVLGEEEGLSRSGGGPPLTDAPTWVIDPIDGTNNYLAGIPIWATLVGLQEGGRNILGACAAPALGETYEGGIGLGARCNGEPISASTVEALEDATVVFAGIEDFSAAGLEGVYRALARGARRTRGLGDFWGHMLVARGAADAMVDPGLSVWDAAALEPIVIEAGGTVGHLDGSPWSGQGTCLSTSTSRLRDEIVTVASGHEGTDPAT